MSLSDSNCCAEPVSYAAVEEDCTSGLVIVVFDDSGKVGADGFTPQLTPYTSAYALTINFPAEHSIPPSDRQIIMSKV